MVRHRRCNPRARRCSPPAWGWSDIALPCRRILAVLPTRVGMVRSVAGIPESQHRAPHPRGDGPGDENAEIAAAMCSPPAWGWSAGIDSYSAGCGVLPTRVGMVRQLVSIYEADGSAPHPRGDGPRTKRSRAGSIACSPPAWGWSDRPRRPVVHFTVLPTRVGMVRPSRRGRIH